MPPARTNSREIRQRRAARQASDTDQRQHERASSLRTWLALGIFCIVAFALIILSGVLQVPALVTHFPLNNTHDTMSLQASSATNKLPHVIVVGGGLAGLSAACRSISLGAHVTLVEKDVLGGNSAKATSGVNGVHSRYQDDLIKQGQIQDSVEAFVDDTVKAGNMINKKELVEVLAKLSGEAIDSLETEFNLTLSDIQQLGGHSAKRTHRFPAKDGRVAPVGFTVVNTIKKHFLTLVDEGKATLLQKTALVDLVIEERTNASPAVTAVVLKDLVENTTTTLTNFTSLIMSAGGYAADSSPGSVLAQNRPDLIGFPTTNGDFASGDMIRIGEKHGLAAIDLDKVQLHPTGFVDPKDPHATRKFLCPEVMRGVGALLVDMSGHRFVDELKPRDKVSAAILKDGGTTKDWGLSAKEDFQRIALMLISQGVAEKFGMAAFNFYMYKGFIFNISDGESLRKYAPSIDFDELQRTLEMYDMACDGQADDCCGKAVFPEKFQINSGNALYGAFVTPSLHYTMGGLEIDANSRAIMKQSREVVANLYIAGETSGGVHGGNRLGGNGCLESLVFGRLAGKLAATSTSY